MRVMQVDVNFGDSSTGKIVQDLRDGLQASGHEVMAVYGRGQAADTPGVVKISTKAEVWFHAGMTRLSGWTGGYSPFATRKLKQAIDSFKPDVIHLHELHGYYVNIEDTVAFLRDRGIPIVWTFHCEFMYTGKCGYANDCERWRSGCHDCPQLGEYPSTLIWDRTDSMYQRKREVFQSVSKLRIVTPSEWLGNRVRGSFLRDRQLDVIYNGVDTENMFYPRDRSVARHRFGIKTRYVAVSIAPDLMSQRKGGQWILDLARRMKNFDISFLMIGVPPDFHTDLVNVIALPRTRDQDLLAQAYSASDVFLLPSEKETFSMVAAESLACGTPVVGFDCGAPLEVAPEGYGQWVDYGDLDGLQHVVKGVLDGSMPLNSPKKCRSFAEQRYSKSGMVARYSNIYRELVGE